MTPEALLAGACAGGCAAGVIGVVVGWRGTPEQVRPVRSRRVRPALTEAQRRRKRIRWAGSAIAGVAVWWLSGWLLAVPLVMLAVLGWPWLMAPTRVDHTGIDRLEALAEWTRRIADLVELGAGLENAIITSRAKCPDAIQSEVSDLVSRLQAHTHTTVALKAFADQFADATSDKIASALILRADDRGPGLAEALKKFANTVRDEVRQRRGIEADRASARLAVRWITYLILVLGAGMALNRDYSEPYASVAGQLVLAVLAAAFIGVLVWMRSVTGYKPTPRFLTDDKRSAVKVRAAEPAAGVPAQAAGEAR